MHQTLTFHIPKQVNVVSAQGNEACLWDTHTHTFDNIITVITSGYFSVV